MKKAKNQVVWVPQAMWDVNFPSRPIERVNRLLGSDEFISLLRASSGQPDPKLADFVEETLLRYGSTVSKVPQDVERLRRALALLGDRGAQEIEKAARQFSSPGLELDMKLRLAQEKLEKIQELAEPDLGPSERSLGGNAAISAERHAYLASPEIPSVAFAGVVRDAHMKEYCTKHAELTDVFKPERLFGGPIEYTTVAISANKFKVMFNVVPGSLSPLLYCSDQWIKSQDPVNPALEKPTYQEFAERICDFFEHDDGSKVLAIGGTSGATANEWKALVDSVKREFQERFGYQKLFLFVSTSGFRADEDGSPDAFAKDLFRQVINQADVISMSLDELEVLHRALCGANPEIPAALKLRQLPIEQHALRVVHSPSGAIADVIAPPTELFNYAAFAENPGGPFLMDSLRFAVDGTTAALESPLGRRLTFDQVRGFSGNISSQHRQLASFDVDYAFPGQMTVLPAGMIGCASPYARNPIRGSLVGLGAQFDSLLLAFLLRC